MKKETKKSTPVYERLKITCCKAISPQLALKQVLGKRCYRIFFTENTTAELGLRLFRGSTNALLHLFSCTFHKRAVLNFTTTFRSTKGYSPFLFWKLKVEALQAHPDRISESSCGKRYNVGGCFFSFPVGYSRGFASLVQYRKMKP